MYPIQDLSSNGPWSAAQEHHRGLDSHHSSSLWTPQTSSTSQSPVICRNTQMTLQLRGEPVMDKVALWHGVGTIISS